MTVSDAEWDDLVDSIEEQEEFERAAEISGMAVKELSDGWWVIPREPGDPPMGFPYMTKEGAKAGVYGMTLGCLENQPSLCRLPGDYR